MLTGLVETSDQWPRVAMTALAADLIFWAKKDWKLVDHHQLFYEEGYDYSDDEGPFEIADSDDATAIRTIIPAGLSPTGIEILKLDIFTTVLRGDETVSFGRHYQISTDWWSD